MNVREVMQVEAALLADVAAMTAIYAHHVLTGSGSFEETPPSQDEMRRRYEAGLAAGYPWRVARDAAGVLGYGYYGPFRAREAYRYTVEDSIYVREDVRGQGVGKAILGALIAAAKTAGCREMLALIGDSENAGSIGVHASLGFKTVGTLRDVGFKLGRFVDVVIMQLSLAEPPPEDGQ
jgi:phosphinothricin acetyltransferase